MALAQQGIPSGASRDGIDAVNRFIDPQAKTTSEFPALLALIHFSGFMGSAGSREATTSDF